MTVISLNLFFSGLEVEKLIRDRARQFDILEPINGNMHVGDLAWLYGEIAFDATALEFKIEDRGHGCVNGNDMLDLISGLKDEKFLVILTGRWFACQRNGERFFLFNFHHVEEDTDFNGNDDDEAKEVFMHPIINKKNLLNMDMRWLRSETNNRIQLPSKKRKTVCSEAVSMLHFHLSFSKCG